MITAWYAQWENTPKNAYHAQR